MAHIRINFVLAIQLLMITVVSCQKSELEVEYHNAKIIFDKSYKNKEIISHFPDKINKKDLISGLFVPPGTKNNFGEMFLTLKIDKESIEKVKREKFIFKDSYQSNTFLPIKIELVRDSIGVDSLGLKIGTNIPIACITQVDYNLGEFPDSSYLADEKKYIPDVKYKMPEDLIIYVIESKAGDYWADGGKSKRCSALGKWRNGYAMGYAISEKLGYITYWVVAW